MSWKTTVSGVLAVLAGIVYIATNALGIETTPVTDASGAVAAILAGIGLLFARDNDKSSEDAGVKK